MKVNLMRGFWRLWLFFSFVWVVFCAWNVIDARLQVQRSTELRAYYVKASADARKLEGSAGMPASVSQHLADQILQNERIVGEQHARDDKFFRLMWLVPIISLIFARGIPWVWEGFLKIT